MSSAPESILIVDDETTIRRLLRQKLSGEGFQCEEASNAEQALEQLRKSTFGLMILDNKMPGKSGLELLPELRTAYPETAVIMATATTDIGIAVEAMKRGAYDYITKPFNQDDLILKIQRALEKRNLKLENEHRQVELQQRVAEQTNQLQENFTELVETLSREHALIYKLADSQRGGKAALSKLPKELQEPMASVEEFREALIRILRRGGTEPKR